MTTAVRSAGRIVVGVSGASGAPYAARLLEILRGTANLETHVVFTRTGRLVWADEVGTDPSSIGFRLWDPDDMTAPFASGSAKFDAMVVVPCSVGQLGRIASGVSADLVGRAADVMLKEQRKLVLVVRESPLSLIHLRNMTALAEAGATILPAAPSFYSRPRSVPELVDTVVSRILDHLGTDMDLIPRWEGLSS